MLTEAEWEYAARAGTTAPLTPNGGGELPEWVYWFNFDAYRWVRTYGCTVTILQRNNNPHGAKEVALLLPNDYGLYDMSGNLWEWTPRWLRGIPHRFYHKPGR